MADHEKNDLGSMLQDRDAISKLAKSKDAQALASLLTQGRDRKDLEQMARSAMSGDMQSMQSLIEAIRKDPAAGELVRRLSESFHGK